MTKAAVQDPNRWQQIEQVFQAALDCDPGSRSIFLERSCGSDTELRQEVESLLASVEESTPHIESAVQDVAASYLDIQPAPVIAPETLLAQYRVIRLLGSGGMGRIYVAEDTRLKRHVALKVLSRNADQDSVFLRRLECEARTLSSLNHPNLLTIFDFCTVDGLSFLVTELVDGRTVREMLRAGALEVQTALDIAGQIAAALKAAHAAGVVHRDIKPENVMVRRDGGVKILDFGIAKAAEGEQDAAHIHTLITQTGSLLGTPRYMSPEQARGFPADARSDIFSFGALLYEMLTGKPAFDGPTVSDLIADILRGVPPRLSARAVKANRLQSIIDRCLAKDPVERYANVEELQSELERARRSQCGPGKLQLRLLQSALIAAVLIVAALLFFRHRVPAPTHLVPRSLAVLPFRNLRPSPDTDFLSFSLADEVITKLGYVKALVIRPASSIARYRESPTALDDLHRVATRLNAQMLLTGTYLKDGGTLRITARLIGFSPQSVLWQNTWTVPYNDLLSVQDSVAHMIIDSLSLQLGPDEKQLLKPERAVNSLAYEYYLRGVDLYAVSDFGAAVTMLEKSAALDPKYAPTWAHLGRAYTTNASLQFGGRRDYHLAEQAYDNAMALNPSLPEPRVYMANLLTDTGRVEQAVRLLRVALQSSPNNAEAHWELGYAYRFGGMLQESVAECELARRLDPEVKINSSALNTYLYLGEYDKFLRSLPPNDAPYLAFYHGFGSYYMRDYATAIRDFDRAFDLSPGLFPAQIGKALSDGLKSNPEDGLTRLHETERNAVRAGVADPEGLYKLAQAYALLGDPVDALRILEQSVTGGFFCYPYISRDPLIASLKMTPALQQTLNKARERWLQFRQRFSVQSQPAG